MVIANATLCQETVSQLNEIKSDRLSLHALQNTPPFLWPILTWVALAEHDGAGSNTLSPFLNPFQILRL